MSSVSVRLLRSLVDGRLRTRGTLVCSVALAGLTASFALWNPLEVYERDQLSRTTHLSMESMRADLLADTESRFLAQVRLAELWGPQFSHQDRKLSSSLFLGHHPGYLALEWADLGGRVVASIGRDGRDEHESTFGTEQALEALRPSLSHPSEEAIVTPRFRLADGRSAMRVVVPVVRHDAIAGFLVAVVDMRAAVDSMADDHKGLGYSMSVRDGSEEIYRMPGSQREYETTLAEVDTVQLPGATWTIRVWPKPEVLSGVRSSLPKLAGVLGGLLGTVLMLAVHFGRTAQRTSLELQRARDELEERVKERTLELEDLNEVLQSEVVVRKRAEDSYRELSGRLLRLQDDERRRIARELHDSTAQLLGALAINVDRARALADSRDPTRLAQVLGESGRVVEEVTQEIRTVSYLLHPPMLDDLGLEYVLPWLADGFGRRSQIAVTLDIQPNLGRLPREIELTFFRIVQEALANVHRHSGSPTVTIVLSRDGDSATLEVRDQGSGMPGIAADAVRGATSPSAPIGVGVVGMRERVRQLSGRLDISSDGGGTAVRAVLPLAEPPVPERARCCGPECQCPYCCGGASTDVDPASSATRAA